MTLVRKTDRRISYYSIALYPTLFDEYLLIHHCGTACSKKAERAYYESKKEALFESLNIIAAQKRRGFSLKKSQNR
jgi:hypothetical protein